MGSEGEITYFAAPQRASESALQKEAKLLSEMPFLQQLYDAVTDMVLILNPQRQIVFCNSNVVKFLGLSSISDAYGLRPGEAFGCIHAHDCAGGCGTSEFCAACDAVASILSAQSGVTDAKQCRILRGDGWEALNLLIRTTPLHIGDDQFVICAITDISDQKRRESLEKIFFHDLLNEATCLKLLADIDLHKNIPEQVVKIKKAVVKIIDEIRAQRDLAAAEHGELILRKESIASKQLLADVVDTYQQYAQVKKCAIALHRDMHDVSLVTDATVLSRVLKNMVKNAIEASAVGDTVTIGCDNSGDVAKFWVHNPNLIPKESQMKIFQRSFSTKGEGRGLGTYSMKLLTERYLGGQVSFTSSADNGTIFKVTLPIRQS
jgi:nitrogen fixation/metabolism regulation signal transduction histidine kinase